MKGLEKTPPGPGFLGGLSLDEAIRQRSIEVDAREAREAKSGVKEWWWDEIERHNNEMDRQHYKEQSKEK